LKFHNLDPVANLIEINTFKDSVCISNDEILYQIEKNIKNTAMILFNGVNYYTGQCYDIESIAVLAKKYNCIIGLDLAHSAGNVKLDLNKWDIDFASWCGYKYLNGGPGAPSGIFVHEKHNNNKLKRFEGWWGHSRETRFDPPDKFDPLLGAEAWQLSNPPILSLAALRSSLELFDEVGIDTLIKKNSILTGYLEYLIKESANKNINIITPSNSKYRGSQLSISIKSNINDIENYFRSKNIICDFRKPNVIRIAPSPFYNSFQDVYNFVQVLQKI
jgi:kynureninase